MGKLGVRSVKMKGPGDKGKPTDQARRLRGSINLTEKDRAKIARDADSIVKMYEEGNIDGLLIESVQFTAMNIAYMKWLRGHPPEGRSNTQALLNGLNEARAQLIELVAMLKEREKIAGKPTGSRKGATHRKRREVGSTRRT